MEPFGEAGEAAEQMEIARWFSGPCFLGGHGCSLRPSRGRITAAWTTARATFEDDRKYYQWAENDALSFVRGHQTIHTLQRFVRVTLRRSKVSLDTPSFLQEDRLSVNPEHCHFVLHALGRNISIAFHVGVKSLGLDPTKPI